MKKVIFLFFYIVCVSSCVQQMEEPESARIAGMWAVVDENNMTTRYMTFEDGYLIEFQSDRPCYVAEGTIWNIDKSTFAPKSRSQYSLIDDVLYYYNTWTDNVTGYYSDGVKLSVKLIVKDDVMILGENKCLPIHDLNSSCYSNIVLSETNKTFFIYTDREIEWEYSIKNPVEGFNLTVKEAPEWCGGAKGVTIDGNKIRFSLQSPTGTLSGKFLFSYLSAADVEVEVGQTDAEIILDNTYSMFDNSDAIGEFSYLIVNKRYGYELEIETDVDWIRDIKNSGDRITYSILENNSGSVRVGTIKLTYAGDSVEYLVIQNIKGNLAQNGTANCYLISEPGNYFFPLTKGNSVTSVGEVQSVEVLWESFGTSAIPDVGDLVKSVSVVADMVVLESADTFKEGNAVIAAKDNFGNILWSWHIWFTDLPQGQEYYNNTGTMMDRNLGATSTEPGVVGTLGLLYQWGRKDPFLGSSSISDEVIAKSTITWPSAVSSNSSNGTIEYATAHPTTFITSNSNSNYDWYYTGSSSTDNTRWTTSETAKSIYDPCPAGWRVPDGGDNGIWSKALGSPSDFYGIYDFTDKGMDFFGMFGSASVIWYPASGCRTYSDGSLYLVGRDGVYWSASISSNSAYCLYFDNDDQVKPLRGSSRAYGRSVRCSHE